ncbi:MAG: MFS transporter, partial [Rubrivivax sp.]
MIAAPRAPKPRPPATPGAAWLVLAAGVCAALHVGKLAPAIAVLQRDLGLTLVEAGFLLGLVQGAGMVGGLLVGAWCDGLGARRSLVLGLLLQAAASAGGALVSGAGPMLALRALEGLGFLMVVLPAPGLLRALTPPQRLRGMLGSWGAFMPLAVALALAAGPPVIESAGWRAWWVALAGVSLAMAATLRLRIPRMVAPGAPGHAPSHASGAPGHAAAQACPQPSRLAALGRRVALTLRAPGPWFVALTFAVYSSQWLAVVGFLPTIVARSGMSPLLTGLVAACVAAVNIVGNAA